MPDSEARHKKKRSRSRSPSPYQEKRRHKHHYSHPQRSRSPQRHDRHRHRHKHHRSRSPPPSSVTLPYKAQKLSKRQYEEYKPLFQSYLDIQKQLKLDELDEREARGRWKSFVSRWNRGDLARSWYDPSMLKTAQETIFSYHHQSPVHRQRRASPEYKSYQDQDDSQSDEDFGPAPPNNVGDNRRAGPTIPKLDDIALRNEVRQEDRAREGLDYRDDIRYERRQDRKLQKERLEELVPKADAGTRERKMEKMRETTNTLKEFRDAKEAGDVEVGESELMGDDDIEGHKRRKVDMERKKSEREIRREEIMRAKTAEREEKLAEMRQKEDATMAYLKAIAKERFG